MRAICSTGIAAAALLLLTAAPSGAQSQQAAASLAAVCNFLFGMEVVEELHGPRRVRFRIADPNCLAYESDDLTEIGLSKPADPYVVGVTHKPSQAFS
jgi:hypothetical protein